MNNSKIIRLSVNPSKVLTKPAGEQITDFMTREFDLGNPNIEKELREIFKSNVHSVNHWVGGCSKKMETQGLNGHCAKVNYRGVWGLALDFDDGELSLAEAREKFKDYIHIIYTSSGHRQDKPDHNGIQDRFRVILPYEPLSDGSAMFNDESSGGKYYEYLKSKYPEADDMVFDLHMKLFPFAGPDPELYKFYLNSHGEWFSVNMDEVNHHSLNEFKFQNSNQKNNSQKTREDLQNIIDSCSTVKEAFESIENDKNNEGTAGHNIRLTVASIIRHTIDDENYVLDLFSKTSDFNKEKTLKHYRSIDKKPITCNTLRDWGLCNKPCQLIRDLNKKSPIVFAYRKGVQLELTDKLLQNPKNDAGFEELIKRTKSIENPVIQLKLIDKIRIATSLNKADINRYMRRIKIYDEINSYIVNGEVDPVKAAKYLIKKYKLMRFQQDFYQYAEGIWELKPQEETESLIHHEIERYSDNRTISEVINAVKRESLITRSRIEEVQDTYVIAANNGLLDVRIQTIKDFKPEDYRFRKMSANYDPKAECPTFVDFIKELFLFDVDAADKRKLVQEIFGYLLIPDYTLIKKMFYFYGVKANNGKSSLIEIIRSVMGSAYFDSVPMDKLNGFMLKRLMGKHANIVGDQDAYTKVPDGMLKQLVGGMDEITADVKYKDAITFINHARLVFAVNKLPYSEAKDEGYFTRAVILAFNNQFLINPDRNNPRQMKADVEKIQYIIEHEKDGILNWMLEGLTAVLNNKKLTIPASSKTALDNYKTSNNTIMLYVAERCDLGTSYSIGQTEAYSDYKEWCIEQGFKNHANAFTFYDLLNREYNVVRRRKNKSRRLEGIKIKP